MCVISHREQNKRTSVYAGGFVSFYPYKYVLGGGGGGTEYLTGLP